MIPGFHGLDLIVILLIALLIFGPKKLPEMGAAIGKSIKEFRKGVSELTTPKEEEVKLPAAAATTSTTDTSKMGLGGVAYEGETVSPVAKSELLHKETPIEQ